MIVLAGGIGSGKSVVARTLRLKGFGVFDCDREAKFLMENEADLIATLNEITEDQAYDSSGRLDKKKLSQLLFENSAIRSEVNKAVHAAVINRLRNWLKESSRNMFVETAIAAESGIAAMAKEIWLVVASPLTRMERVRLRDTRPDEQILKIMETQAREEEKLYSTGVEIKKIFNDPEGHLLERINELLTI